MDLSQLAIFGLIVFGAIGLVAGVALAFAAVRFRVETDPRIDAVKHCLSGANCGACAYPGCESYAEAVVLNPEVPPDLCRPGGPAAASKVAKLTGKTLGAMEPVMCVRRCVKDEGNMAAKYEYTGVSGCAAASLALGGPDGCAYSCLGFGDCVRACPFDAMRIVNDMVKVDQVKCTGCGVCVKVCPKKVLGLIPADARVMIHCSSRDKGKDVMAVCEVGCIACAKCVKKCPAECITMEDNKIVIDHKSCLAHGPDCAEVCAEVCPRDILRTLATGVAAMRAKHGEPKVLDKKVPEKEEGISPSEVDDAT